MWSRYLIVVLVGLLLSPTLFAYDRYKQQDTFPPPTQRLKLSHSFLLPDSERIYVSGRLLAKNSEYQISYLDGVIYLSEIPRDTVKVFYQIFPYDFRRTYYHRILPEAETSPPVVETSPGLVETEEVSPSPFKMEHSGNIFRSVSIGSEQDASMDAGLDLKLSGKIGDKTSVTAIMSDQNLPLQPEGNTRTLEEIDKVYVSVQSEDYGLNLGDYELSIKEREFASLNRKLTGAEATYNKGDLRLLLSAATSKGEYRSQSFTGSEGLQGPYLLTGRNGETNILILAGTEKVWVDGVAKIRGGDYDYTIDYSRGEITFTEKVPIDVDSRIVVDFEYSSGNFNRTLLHNAGEFSLAEDKLKLSYVFAQEGDNGDEPLAFALTPEIKQVLNTAGDNPELAVMDGAVPDSVGDYDRIYESDSSFYYQWAGEGNGEYDVAFTYVGENQGTYRREYNPEGNMVYIYQFGLIGNYEPIKIIPLPQSKRMGDVALAYSPNDEIETSAEFATSAFDQNTYSPLDEADNDGYAFNMAVSGDSLKLPGLNENGYAGFTLKGRSISPDFNRIDRTETAEYNRRWGYEDTLSQEEQSWDFSGYISPTANLKFRGGAGSLSKSEFSSFRQEAGLDYLEGERTLVSLFGENILTESGNSSGWWRRLNSDVQRQIGIFRPMMRFEGEDRSQAGDGFRFQEYSPALNIGIKNPLLLEHTYREDEMRSNNRLSPLSKLNRSRVFYHRKWRLSEFTGNYIHTIRNYDYPDSADIVSDLGRLEFDTRSQNGGAVLSFKHHITQSRTAEVALIPLEVGWGEGDYVKIGYQYFPDPNGNYILYSQPTGDFTPSAKVESTLNLRLDPNRLQFLKQLSPLMPLLFFESYFSVKEESAEKNPWPLYLLSLNQFRTTHTLYGSQTFRQDIYYRRGERNFSARLRWNDYRYLNNRTLYIQEKVSQDDLSLQLNKALSKQTTLQSTAHIGWENRQAFYSMRKMTFLGWDHLFSQRISSELESRLGMGMESAQDKRNDISAFSLSMTPQVEYSFQGKGRITLEASWSGVFSTAEYIPYELTEGRGKGSNFEWSSNSGFGLGKNLNLNLNYRGEAKVNRPVIHSGRMELRAFF
jgi:hypothetical protein